MRTLQIDKVEKSTAFLALLDLLKDEGFDVLDRDGIQFVIDSVRVNPTSGNKHVSVSGAFSENRLEVGIDVRNMGLELKRDRSNDRIEIMLIRKLHRELVERRRLKPSGTFRLSA